MRSVCNWFCKVHWKEQPSPLLLHGWTKLFGKKAVQALKSGLCPFLGALPAPFSWTQSLSQWPGAALWSLAVPATTEGVCCSHCSSRGYCRCEGSLGRLILGCCPWGQAAAAVIGIFCLFAEVGAGNPARCSHRQ